MNKIFLFTLVALTVQGLHAEMFRGSKQHATPKKQTTSHEKDNGKQSPKNDCDDHEKECSPCHLNNNDRNEPNCPGRHETLRLGIFDFSILSAPFTVLDLNTMTASGFDIQLWCQLARCLNRQFEFIAFSGDLSFFAALQALQDGDIDVIATSLPHAFWLAFGLPPSTNFLVNLECPTPVSSQTLIWDEQHLPQPQFDAKKVTSQNMLTDLWKIDNLVFGTSSSTSKQYNDLRLAARIAGRSDEYFTSHIITNANYSKNQIEYVTHFGPIGSDDKYQVLYVEQSPAFVESLKKLQVCPYASTKQQVDLLKSSIKSFIMPLQQEELSAFGYITRRDCCQFVRDAQECINALICDGTYFQICQIIAEQFPESGNFCECIPPLYASFFHGTVSRQCICCTFPHRPCEKRNVCDIPCNPTFTLFTGTAGR